MEIISNTMIDILVYLILPILLVWKLKKSKEENILENNTTNILKGFFVIYVAIHHYVQNLQQPGILNPLNHVGFICVSFFFLMSGYGLTISYKKNKNLKYFFRRRFIRLYFPFVIANILIGVLYNIVLNSKYSIAHILISSFTLRTVYSNDILWYIFVQILLYIIFYTSFKIFKEQKYQISYVFIFIIIYMLYARYFNQGPWRYNTVMCFFMGIIIAIYKVKIIKFISNNYKQVFVLIGILFLLSWYLVINSVYSYYATFISAIVFCLFITIFTYRFKLESKIFRFLGNISYEIYIVQLPIVNMVIKIIGINIISLLIVLFITVFVSTIANKLAKSILKKCELY